MSKGHTIPLLHLTKLIHNHRPHATFTIFTTPSNEPFISSSLASLPLNTVTVICLPLSATNDDIPLGVESTDQLSSMSLFYSFALSTENIQPHFENALEKIQKSSNPISYLICDGFLYWTQESASKFNILRLTFTGMNMYSFALIFDVKFNRVFSEIESEDKLVNVPYFHWITVRKDEFDETSLLENNDPKDPNKLDFKNKFESAHSMSYVMVVNSFYEIEQPFVDYLNLMYQPKSWCIGPFCLVKKKRLEVSKKPEWIKWLDKKLCEKKLVLYVAFGSQVEISNEQLKEILIGLEKSRVNFLWVLRVKPNQEEILQGFEENIKDKGLVVRNWVDQMEVLQHEGVNGFLSHCGWNSTIEGICAGVPILAWPMMAEQHLNAKLVVEEIKVGLRVKTCDGSPRGFVKWDGLSEMVRELMEGEVGMKVKKKVKELSEVAKKSIEEEGSSWANLKKLLNELEMEQKCFISLNNNSKS